MDLRQHLSQLTKLVPDKKPAVSSRLAPLYPEQGFALPSVASSYEQPLADLGHLADPCLLPGLRDYRWEQIAFVDTETTGLSTGVGTYVILLGIGTFSQGVFTVRQYFLPDPGLEDRFWPQVLCDLQSYPLLCTFNGRSYDLPLINNRLTMNGAPSLEPAAHLDLLFPARRLWRRLLPSCSLQSLEAHRLDWHRTGDVPGALIPSIYYDYLKTGNPEPLQPVFTHNCRDIVSLFELTAQLAASCSKPAARFARAEEFFGLAEAHLRSGSPELAEEMIVSGLERPGDEYQKRRYLQRLAHLQSRAGRYQQALGTWDEAATLEPLSLLPLVEMAKLQEHQLRDLPSALRLTERAVAVCRKRERLGVPVGEQEQQQLNRRLERLQKRLQQRP